MLDSALRVIENVIIAVTFAFITFLAFANVIARYVFSASFSFTSELLVNLAVLLTLVGASAATRNGSHPAFSMLRDGATGVARKIIVALVCLAMIAFLAIFCWLGYDMVVDQASSGGDLLPRPAIRRAAGGDPHGADPRDGAARRRGLPEREDRGDRAGPGRGGDRRRDR